LHVAFRSRLAAGALLQVIADDLVPESHARGTTGSPRQRCSPGFCLMLALDNTFGP